MRLELGEGVEEISGALQKSIEGWGAICLPVFAKSLSEQYSLCLEYLLERLYMELTIVDDGLSLSIVGCEELRQVDCCEIEVYLSEKLSESEGYFSFKG